MSFDFITASIVFVPACYAALVGFQFVSGLISLWNRPQVHQTLEESLFVPNPNEPTYTQEDHDLVDSYIAQHSKPKIIFIDNVIPFVRPKLKHPALETMTLKDLRKLGSKLKIKGASRWTKAEALEILATRYRKAA